LVGTAIDRITKIIEPGGGTVASFDRWGRKRFAYEIGNQHEGYYLVVRFTADPAVQPDLERALKLADEVIRHKILAVPKKALATSPAPA
jgi:small subunit ribosomal protein S6